MSEQWTYRQLTGMNPETFERLNSAGSNVMNLYRALVNLDFE